MACSAPSECRVTAVNEKPILGPLASLQERAAAAKTLPCCAFSQPGVNIAAVNLEWDEHRCLTDRSLRQEGDVSPGSPAGLSILRSRRRTASRCNRLKTE
jgi:hypothetical protein